MQPPPEPPKETFGVRVYYGSDQLRADKYLYKTDVSKWTHSHKQQQNPNQSDDSNDKLIQFAKDIFQVWDSDGDG